MVADEEESFPSYLISRCPRPYALNPAGHAASLRLDLVSCYYTFPRNDIRYYLLILPPSDTTNTYPRSFEMDTGFRLLAVSLGCSLFAGILVLFDECYANTLY